MSTKKSIALSIVTHLMAGLVGGFMGAYLYRSLTLEDPDYLAEVAQSQQERTERDQALNESVRDDSGEPLSGTYTFTAHGNNGMSNVTFTSDAPLEKIVGNTSKVSGELHVDLAHIGNTTGSISIDISSLRTGIDARDKHLRREDWLHTDAHPMAIFALEKVTFDGKPMVAGRPKSATLEGTMEIKGTKRPASLKVSVRYFPWSKELEGIVSGDVLRIDGSFQVKLSDYGVEVPAATAGMKIAEDVRIELSIAALTDGPSKP